MSEQKPFPKNELELQLSQVNAQVADVISILSKIQDSIEEIYLEIGE